MNCIFVKSRMSSYIDGELSGDEMLAMRRHVENCCDCRSQYDSEIASKRLLSSLPEREASPGLERRILDAVKNSAGAEATAPTVLWPSGKLAFALAAAAVAMFCVFLLRGNDNVGQPVNGNDIAYDQDWNNARSVFPANNLPAGLDGP